MKFEIYYPLKPLFISQRFGETALLPYYNANGVNFAGHNGLDMVAQHGQPIYATHDGTAFYQIDSKQGHGVVLLTNTKFEYKGDQVFFKTIYWHMVDSLKEPAYKSPIEDHPEGVQVKAGDIIGYVNSTGLSTGDHLHFGLKPCLPGEEKGSWGNIDQNNGYQGAIDPVPYFNGKNGADINNISIPFSTDLELDSEGKEVARLQRKLQELGYFPQTIACTGYYGSVTRNAVFVFQQDYITNLSWIERYVYRGRFFGQKSRAALNKLQ